MVCDQSAGATVVGEIIQKRDKADPATLVGKGKLEEIAGGYPGVEKTTVIQVKAGMKSLLARFKPRAMPRKTSMPGFRCGGGVRRY